MLARLRGDAGAVDVVLILCIAIAFGVGLLLFGVSFK